MSSRLLLLTSLVLISALSVFAADVTGKWVAQVPGRDGQTREQVFNFKAEGDKLTGTTSGFRGGELPISDGKIAGDDISFKVNIEFQGNTMTQSYSGKVSGSEMKLTRQGGRGGPQEITAKKQ